MPPDKTKGILKIKLDRGVTGFTLRLTSRILYYLLRLKKPTKNACNRRSVLRTKKIKMNK
jgi:hypothetical protein